MKIRLMRAAIRDLREAHAYIAAQDIKAAYRVGLRLTQAISLIGDRPSLGHSTSDHLAREWSVPGLPYIIPYRISGDTVEIIRIWHTRRQRPDKW